MSLTVNVHGTGAARCVLIEKLQTQEVSAALQTRFTDWNVQFGTAAAMETTSARSSSGAAKAAVERRALIAAIENFILTLLS